MERSAGVSGHAVEVTGRERDVLTLARRRNVVNLVDRGFGDRSPEDLVDDHVDIAPTDAGARLSENAVVLVHDDGLGGGGAQVDPDETLHD